MLKITTFFKEHPDALWLIALTILAFALRYWFFWNFPYPANVATDNWTAIPADWDSLRTRWEYSHALGAAFQVLAMSGLIIAALGRAHPQS